MSRVSSRLLSASPGSVGAPGLRSRVTRWSRTAPLVARHLGQRRRLRVALGVIKRELGHLIVCIKTAVIGQRRGGSASSPRAELGRACWARELDLNGRTLFDPQMRSPPIGAKMMAMMNNVGRTVRGVRIGCHALSRCCLNAVSGRGKREGGRHELIMAGQHTRETHFDCLATLRRSDRDS